MTYPLHAAPRRRPFAFGLIALTHAALIVGWQASRVALPWRPDARRLDVLWIAVPARAHAPRQPDAQPQPRRPAAAAPRPAQGTGLAPAPTPPAAVAPTPPSGATARAPDAASPDQAPAPAPTAQAILERARRDLGPIIADIRKERRGIIVLPPDSPQIRLRKGIEAAHDAVPPKPWEAPRIEEVTNGTSNGARVTRVTSGLGTYCITERSPATDARTIEMHGMTTTTTCPQTGSAPTSQEWHSPLD